MARYRAAFRRMNTGWLFVGEGGDTFWNVPHAVFKDPDKRDRDAEELIRRDGKELTRFLKVGQAAGEPSVYIDATTPEQRFEFWSQVEQLPWEVLEDEHGNSAAVVRAISDAEQSRTVTVGPGRPRVLLIAASPEGAEKYPVDKAIMTTETAFAALGVGHDVKVIKGSDTLQSVRKAQGEWDCVFVFAHGERVNQGRIMLEGSNREKSPRLYKEFARDLAEVLLPPGGGAFGGLVFLAVCSSSPLAIEIGRQLPGCRIIACGAKIEMESLFRFLGRFLEGLVGKGKDRSKGLVERAFQIAVSDEDSDERFVPVLYAPSEPRILLDFSELKEYEGIQQLMRDGAYRDAEDKLLALSARGSDVQRAWAKKLLIAAKALSAGVENLEELREAVSEAVVKVSPRRWARLRDQFAKRQVHEPSHAGIEVGHDTQAPNLEHQGFAEVLANMTASWDRGRTAVQKLAEFENSKTAVTALQNGCQGLQTFQENDGKVASTVFGQELRRLLRESLDRLNAAGDRSGKIDACLGAIEDLRLVQRLLGTGGWQPEGTDQEDVDELRVQVFSRVREVAATLVGAAEPPDLLRPGHRAALVRWLTGARPRGPTAREPALSSDPEELTRWLESERGRSERPVGAKFGLTAEAQIAPRLVTALVNERAPVVLAARLSEGIHDYLLLHPYGVRSDVKMEGVSPGAHDAILADGDLDETERQLLSDSVERLRDVRYRLTLDLRLLPCDKADLVTERLLGAASSVLAAEAPRAGLAEQLGPLDRVTVLAVSGDLDRASGEAIKMVREHAENPVVTALERFEGVRAAFLVEVHAMDCDPEIGGPTFVAHARSAIGLLGMMLGRPDLIRSWVNRRVTVYGLNVRSQKEQAELAEVMGNGLRQMLDTRFSTDRAKDESVQEVLRSLRREVAAELLGIRHVRKLKVDLTGPDDKDEGIFSGGARGAELLSCTAAIAERIAHNRDRVARMSPAEIADHAATFGLNREVLQDLSVAFSELRLASVDSSRMEKELTRVREWLGNDDTLDMGEISPQISALLRSTDAAKHFPVHVLLGAGVLAADAAALVSRCALVELEAELRKENLKRPPVVALVKTALGYGQYARKIQSTTPKAGVAGPSVRDEVDKLLASWVNRLIKDLYEDDSQKHPTCARLEQALKLVEKISGDHDYLMRGALAEAKTSLQMHMGPLLAAQRRWGEALAHARAACDVDRPRPDAVRALLLIAAQASDAAEDDGDQSEAKRILDDAVRILGDFERAQPEAARELSGEAQILRDKISARRAPPLRPVVQIQIAKVVKP